MRPSVWDLAKIPSINKNIRKYYETEAPDDLFLKDYISGSKLPVKKPENAKQSMTKENENKS